MLWRSKYNLVTDVNNGSDPLLPLRQRVFIYLCVSAGQQSRHAYQIKTYPHKTTEIWAIFIESSSKIV